ncbi:MAG: SDR family oxidoreductase [Chloroflexota bacterium]
MTNLNRATVLLTGATGGFGIQLIYQLLAKNSRLILTDIDQVALKKVAQEAKTAVSSGEIIACIGTDLATEKGREHLYESVEQLNVPVDVLINNAGVAVMGRHDEVPKERWSFLMHLNLLAPMEICAHFMPQMIDRKKGHIVNISSVAGWIGPRGLSSYAASKFGLRGFSEAISDELAPFDVKVTAVYPYFSRTPILDSESHGSYIDRGSLPDSELTDPADIMAKVIQAIESNKLHLFPDTRGKQLQFLKRLFPSLLKTVGRRFQ